MLDHQTINLGSRNSESTLSGALHGAYRKDLPSCGYLLVIVVLFYPVAILTKYRFFYIMALLSLFIVTSSYLARGRISIKGFSEAKEVYLFFLLTLVSYFWSLYKAETIWIASISLVFLWIFHASQIAFRKGDRRWFSSIVLFLPYLCLILSATIFMKFNSLRPTSYEMLQTVGSFSDVAPRLLEICLPYLIYMFFNKKGTIRLPVSGGIISIIIVILLSQSRGAYLMMFTSIVLSTLLFSMRLYLRLRNALWLVAFIIAAIVFAISIFGYENSIGPTINRFSQSEVYVFNVSEEPDKSFSDYNRSVMYYEGVQALKSYPITGIGFGALMRHIEDMHGFECSSHNIIITAWAELGLPGVFIMFLIFLSAFKRVWRTRSSSKYINRNDFYFYSATLIALIVAVLHAQFQPQLSNPLFYVLLAIAFTKKPWNNNRFVYREKQPGG